MKYADFIIIGGGIIGLSCAWRLSQQGLNITLIDAASTGHRTSGAAAGALKPFDACQKGAKQKLQQESLWQYPAFVEELEDASGINLHYSPCGRLQWLDTDRLQERTPETTQQANTDWPFENKPVQSIINSEEAIKIAPEMATPHVQVMHCRASAGIDPRRTLDALRIACLQNGVRFIEGTPATPHVAAGKIKGVKTYTGEVLPAKNVLITAGVWTMPLVEHLCPQVKLRPIKKQAVELRLATPLETRLLIDNRHVYIVPRPDGRSVYVGARTIKGAGWNDTPNISDAQWLHKKAAEMMPVLKKATLMRSCAGLQPRTGSHQSLYLGPSAAIEGLYVATGHGGVGFCMAPITADLLAKSVVEPTLPEKIHPFLPK